MNEYRFRQCPKDGNVQCNMGEGRCGGCPIAKAAPAPAARKTVRLTSPSVAEHLRETPEFIGGYADATILAYEKLSRYEDTGLEPEEIKIRWERTR